MRKILFLIFNFPIMLILLFNGINLRNDDIFNGIHLETINDNQTVYDDSNLVSNEPLIKYDFPYIDEEVEMPISGYMGVIGDGVSNTSTISFLTKSNIRTYKEAGFNLMAGLYEREPIYPTEVRKALRICEEEELTYFLSDVEFAHSYNSAIDLSTIDTVEEMIASLMGKYYIDSPALGGIVVRDEPSIHSFVPLGRVNEALRTIDSDKIIYSTLFPKGASEGQLGYNPGSPNGSTWEQYENYIRSYVELVNPTVLPYDSYVLYREDQEVSDVNAKDGSVGNFIRQLSLYRNIAMENNIPYWVTIASWNHPYRNSGIPFKQNSWVLNASLAYGAKGVQYYTYWNTYIGGTSPETWGNQNQSGLVSINGTPHDNYYKIQKLNQQIKSVDHVLMQATHKGVMQFGTQHLSLVEKDCLDSYGELENIKGDAFVGCFELNGNSVYYIVNNSCDSGIKTFKIDFNQKVNVRMTNYYGTNSKNNVSTIGVNLSGGEAILLEVL